MGIREKIEELPVAGSIKRVEVPGLGTVGIRRLSAGELLALPETKTALHAVVASAVDENGDFLFASIGDAEHSLAAVGYALIRACNQVNTIDLEEAAKN